MKLKNQVNPITDYISKVTDPTYINPSLQRAARYNPKIILRKAKNTRPNTMMEPRHRAVQSNIKNSMPPSLRQEMQKVAKEQKLDNFIDKDIPKEKVLFMNKGLKMQKTISPGENTQRREHPEVFQMENKVKHETSK